MKALFALIGSSIVVAVLVGVPASVSAGQSQSWDKKIDNRRGSTMSTNNIQPANNNFAFYSNFEPGGSFNSDPKIAGLHRFWCVRSGHGYDGNNVP